MKQLRNSSVLLVTAMGSEGESPLGLGILLQFLPYMQEMAVIFFTEFYWIFWGWPFQLPQNGSLDLSCDVPSIPRT